MKKMLAALPALVTALSLTPALAATYTPGTYEGTGTGRLGTIKASVTFSEDAITAVEITEQSETPFLSDKAFAQIPADIVAQQSLGVDTVSGSTFTSRGIIAAVSDAVAQAGGDAAALKKVPVSYAAQATEDLSCDVLVVGGGTAGLVASYTAANAGAKTIMIEKLDVIGGTLNEAAGLLLTVNSEQNDAAVDDSLDRVLNFYRTANTDSVHGLDYDLTSALMSETGKTVDMLINLGYAHVDIDNGNYAGTLFTRGYKLVSDLMASAESAGVTMLTGTKAKSIVVDEAGNVTGVIVENDSGEYTISAKKVILATGGSSWSPDLRASQTQLANMDVNEKTQIGSTGDGVHMLEAIGAQISPDLYVKSSQPDLAAVFHNDWSNTPNTGMTLMINAEGKRFCNEAPAAATVVNAKMLADGSSGYWTLIDAENTIGFDADYFETVKGFADQDSPKVVVYAESASALAEKLGIDPATLQSTLDAYNAACASGTDEAFGKSAANLVAYPDGCGFYAVYRRVGSWGTIGGAIVDAQMHVLNTNGEIIPNVFAAGEVATSQYFGDYYFGGFSLGLYTTAGRIAAETAVSEMAE